MKTFEYTAIAYLITHLPFNSEQKETYLNQWTTLTQNTGLFTVNEIENIKNCEKIEAKELATGSQNFTSNLLNLGLNIILPSLILSKASRPDLLGPVWALIVALSFPLLMGLIEMIKEKKVSFLSMLGLSSTLLSGTFALYQLNQFWFAVKEASIPLLVAVFLLILFRKKSSMIIANVLRPQLFKLDRLTSELKDFNAVIALWLLIKKSFTLFLCSFFLSAILNFGLAEYLLIAPAGTEEFNKQLGQMTAMSYFVITIPTMILVVASFWYFFSGIKKLTGLDMESVLNSN